MIDIKRRGLLDETLVICCDEFGHTPASQRGSSKPVRDHSPSGYTTWLAGGGVKGGQIIGVTDEVGSSAIERPVHPNDLHATILQALGLDQHELVDEHHNRRELVTVNGGQLIREVFGELPTEDAMSAVSPTKRVPMSPFLRAGLMQICLTIFTGLILDGGIACHVFLRVSVGYWCGVLLIMLRRSASLTPADLVYLRHGLWGVLLISFPIAVQVTDLAGGMRYLVPALKLR